MNTPRRSLLEESPLRVPEAGRIRTGIKVLTATGKANSTAVKIYEEGVANDRPYYEIDRKIKAECKAEKSFLTPKNTPYFRVSKHDFLFPEIAEQILRLYAEDRGDGLRLYRFPVVLVFDDWLQNMPHALKAYRANELKYQSEYDALGDRYCMQHKKIEAAPGNRRAPRNFGGRGWEVRSELNQGRCIPEQCPQYQNRECKLSGKLQFYIPGIPGSGLISMGTTSFYSLDQIHAQMEMLSRIRNGRISGTIDGQPVFFLTKVEEEVSMLDENGEPKMVKQFLVKMETKLPMTQLMAASERRALAAPEHHAPAAIAARPLTVEETTDAGDGGEPSPETLREKIRRLRAELNDALEAKGYDDEDIQEFSCAMADKFGETWSRDADTLEKAMRELETHQ